MPEVATRDLENSLPTWVADEKVGKESFLQHALRSHVLSHFMDIKRRLEPFQQKYQLSFPKFKSKVESLEEEDFELWDDFIVWEGLYDSYKLWDKRYRELS